VLEALVRKVGSISHPQTEAPAAARLVNYYGHTAAAEVTQQMAPGLPYLARLNVAGAVGMIARH